MNWLLDNIIFLTISGSQSYGMATETSDVDLKGITFVPQIVREHLFNKFEQTINDPQIELKYSHLKNPKNPKLESTIYSLKKFIELAAQCNPNIIELLWVTDKNIQTISDKGRKLVENRELFLSTKTKFTFSGYAFAQAAKIERHRKWLIKGELQEPQRKDFGLPEEVFRGFGEIERYIRKTIDSWLLSEYGLDDLMRQDLNEKIWEVIYNLSQNTINWDNWPQKYEIGALNKFVESFNLSAEINELIVKEIQFKNTQKEFNNWLNWKKNRNLARKSLEEKHLYDTKHGAHLIRLMRMGLEILSGKGVITERPDAEELLEIRNGKWSYDELMDNFKNLDNQLNEVYKVTKLPRSVNYEKINELYQSLL